MSQVRNKMSLAFESRSVNEAFARTAVAAFVATLDPTVEELSDIKTAVSEAVTNCVVHAYRDTIGLVRISAKILEGSHIVIQIKDRGCGIPDVAKAMEPMYTTKPDMDRSGMGFAFMEAFMDELEVISEPGQGTTVLMSKKLGTLPFIDREE